MKRYQGGVYSSGLVSCQPQTSSALPVSVHRRSLHGPLPDGLFIPDVDAAAGKPEG